ncbi:nuclease A inhibitor family protein [Leptolyngbya sp. AN03gr2]|uniref:nuclease A inhibitor family protein n=1 Tax=Leptolyngbya sp. AN03gr2 TaxID=3423364 RepID=UPI003D30F725
MSSLSDSLILQVLKRLTQGLTWESETNAPFRVGGFNHLDRSNVVSVSTVEDFFRPALNREEFADRFKALLTWIKQSLRRVKVYKIKTDQPSVFEIYIVGISYAGNYLGLNTQVVET